MAMLDTQFSLLKGQHFEQVFGRKTVEKYKTRYDCLVVLRVHQYHLITNMLVIHDPERENVYFLYIPMKIQLQWFICFYSLDTLKNSEFSSIGKTDSQIKSYSK